MEIYFWHLHLKNLSLYTYVYLKLTMPSKGLTRNNSNNILAHLILIDSSIGKQNDKNDEEDNKDVDHYDDNNNNDHDNDNDDYSCN